MNVNVVRAVPNLPDLIQRGRLFVLTPAGWTSTLVGTGAIAATPMRLRIDTGTTNPSSAIASCQPFGLDAGAYARWNINADKDLRVTLIIASGLATANTIFRFQIKTVATEGVLADLGWGIQLTNLALVGEAYGSARGTVTMGTLTSTYSYLVEIRHTAGSGVEFFLDGVSKGTLTGTNLPSGELALGGTEGIVLSIINGATTDRGLVDARPPIIWQER